jgi:hypothetical protein
MVVEEGQVFIKCVDSFEDIFEVSKDLIGSQKLELTDVLEPGLFESHKQVVNALFEVYYDLGTEYVKTQYFAKNKIKEDAARRVRERYGLD